MQKSIIWIMLTCLLCSCVDDKYDLGKDVEIKVNFAEKGLTLPTSSTNLIALDQIIELKEGGQLTTDAAGNYLFYKMGNDLDSTVVCIGQGSICNSTETIIRYNFKEDSELKRTTINERYNTAQLEFKIEGEPQYKPDVMPLSIRALEYVKTEMTISFIIYDNNIGEFASEISEIEYHVPSYYDLADPSELKETRVRVNGVHEHIIHCKGVNFRAATAAGEKIDYDNKTGKMTFIGKVGMSCIINTAHMDEYDALENPQMQVRVTTGTLGTNEVTGRFDKSEEVEIDPIEFHDLPDFIRNDEVEIDIDNPVVRLTVDNEVPARALINGIMKAYKNGKETARMDIGETYGTDSIKFEGGKKQTVWISRKPTETPDTVAGNVTIANIIDLLKTVPDRIEIEGLAHTDSSQVVTMGLNKDYIVRPMYELVAPLVIGKNMKLAYTAESDDLHSTLKNFEINSLTVTADITNNIPLDLTAKLKAMDSEGEEIEGIVLTQSQTIKGLDKTDIVLTITGNAEDFQKLDKIEIKAYAESSEALAGQMLNENQALKLENVKVNIK